MIELTASETQALIVLVDYVIDQCDKDNDEVREHLIGLKIKLEREVK